MKGDLELRYTATEQQLEDVERLSAVEPVVNSDISLSQLSKGRNRKQNHCDHTYAASPLDAPILKKKVDMLLLENEQLKTQCEELKLALIDTKKENMVLLVENAKNAKIHKQIESMSPIAKSLFQNEIENQNKSKNNLQYSADIINFALVQSYYSNAGG